MNTIKPILYLTFIVLSTTMKAQSSEEALEYLTEVTSSLEEFRIDTWNVLKSTVQNKSSSELESRILGLTNKIESTRKGINNEEGFYGDLSAKVAMTVYLRTAYDILSQDFKEIRTLEKRSPQSFEAMEKYLMSQNKANERLSEGGERLDNELKRFANRYKIEVTEEKSALAVKIERASQALGYYNQVYLSYFKVYHQKLSVYNALKSENMEKISNEIRTLKEYAQVSLDRLLILDGFMEDYSLHSAATNIIEQFLFEANEVFPTALRAIERKHIFNMAQEVFDTLPEEEKTNTDIAHVNSLIDPLNQAIDDQNTQFSTAESKRQELFNIWNREIMTFFVTYLN